MTVAKVTNFSVQILGRSYEDVGWFYVQVDDVVLVEEIQTQSHLEDYRDLVTQVDLFRGVVEDELKVVTHETLHYDEGVQGLLDDL